MNTLLYLRIGSVFFLIALWQITALLADSSMFPAPLAVLNSLIGHISNGELLHHLGITLYRVTMIFLIAMPVGIAFGLLMGNFKKIDAALDTLLVLGLNMPALVVIMLCYIWFGLSDVAAILAVVINKVPMVIVTIREGVKAIDKKLLEVAYVYKVSRYRLLFTFYIPQLYPYIIASARNGLSLIWKIVLVVELLGRSDGIGFQLSMFFQFFDITSILAYSFSFIVIIIGIENFIFRPIEVRIAKWR
ncbi:ABC transporter permease subunit [Sulfuricurvum sp.]|uniref:ABC transporter permease n=1 Tax=Sulfuricurvum sp. TaxID=2025608 RepID=UPI0026103960|nr:ABC transporter permease subunit [Sulfuricurvum sp.]MDD2266756.1 ABC transporter permease subunit [Sulfuricurvum sp.]MDD2784579.1 ABC transporter permease subunit [Sulfuricurvum sp.]